MPLPALKVRVVLRGDIEDTLLFTTYLHSDVPMVGDTMRYAGVAYSVYRREWSPMGDGWLLGVR